MITYRCIIVMPFSRSQAVCEMTLLRVSLTENKDNNNYQIL